MAREGDGKIDKESGRNVGGKEGWPEKTFIFGLLVAHIVQFLPTFPPRVEGGEGKQTHLVCSLELGIDPYRVAQSYM